MLLRDHIFGDGWRDIEKMKGVVSKYSFTLTIKESTRPEYDRTRWKTGEEISCKRYRLSEQDAVECSFTS